VKVALIGSVSSSWYTLDALIRGGADVACVLGVDESQANRVGDYRSLRELADCGRVPFRSFIKVTEPPVADFLASHSPDLLFVIGLSQMVPEAIIRIAPGGGVGFHPTMLPKGRGRAPVAWTILNNAPAAANLFYLTDQPDAGDIIIQREVTVLPDDYSEDLIQRTNEVLSDIVTEIIPQLNAGHLPRTPQDHSRATHYPRRTPADGHIDWSDWTDSIYRLIRAAGRPYHGAFSFVGDEKLTIWRAKPVENQTNDNQPIRHQTINHRNRTAPIGVITSVDPDSQPIVTTGDGFIKLTQFEFDPQTKSRSTLQVGTVLT
jgi:methionyl-tRNA formyltransferase